MANLAEALLKLDPSNEHHWTKGGDPKLGVVAEFLGAPVTRQEVIDAAPGFTRQTAGGNDAAPETEEPEPEEDEPETDQSATKAQKEIEKLRKKRIALVEKMNEATGAVDKANAKILDIQNESAKIDEAIEKLQPKNSNQVNIQNHLRGQARERQRRADERSKVLANLKPEDLDPRAPIDRAFTRNRNRHSKRPSRV